MYQRRVHPFWMWAGMGVVVLILWLVFRGKDPSAPPYKPTPTVNVNTLRVVTGRYIDGTTRQYCVSYVWNGLQLKTCGVTLQCYNGVTIGVELPSYCR